LLSCLLNITLCHWKLKEWRELVQQTQIVLKDYAPSNTKAFYRYLVALYNLKDYHLVLSEFDKFEEMSSLEMENYPEILEVVAKSRQTESKIKEKEKGMYKNILESFSS